MLIQVQDISAGYNPITDMVGAAPGMLMDIGIQKIAKGQCVTFLEEQKESAFLLMDGEAVFKWAGLRKTAERHSLFDENPSALHVAKGTEVVLTAVTDCEVLIQKTTNEQSFKPRFYSPEDCRMDLLGENVWNDMARRIVRTVFDLDNAPSSNMVLGEVVNYPGRWSSYIPHGHDQPEVYYYRFDKENGFGAAFIGEDVYKISDNTALCIPGGPTHPQVSAPGFAMWYCWMIRHLKDNPWDKRVNDQRYEWLLKKDVKIWPEKE